MENLRRILVPSVLLVLLSCGNCQYPLQACCDLKLMDAGGRVAIETGRALTPGTYLALSVRFCARDTVFIQIWTMINDSAAQLKWQTSFTPTSAQNTRTFVTVTVSSPLVITSNDRLGLYGVVSGSNWTKVSVPYDLDSISGAVYFTQRRFSDTTALAVGLQAALDTVRRPRTFSSFVRYCATSDCSDLPVITPPVQPTASPGLPSCGCPSTCSPDAVLKDNLDQQSALVNYLADQVNRMQSLIANLASSTVQTGYCPPGMLSGMYGLGSCYVVVRKAVQLGNAALECSLTWNGNLVEIDTQIEEDFLYAILTNTTTAPTGPESFWTAGMFSRQKRQWTWYYQDWTPRSPITANNFQNWQYNVVPTPVADNPDICLVLTVDVNAPTNQKNIYWQNGGCFTPPKYFVCEIPKICF